MPMGLDPKLAFDSKVFETKYAQDTRNQFDGGKTGASWRTLIRGYIMSRCPIAKYLLQWAEDFKKEKITMEHVQNLDPIMGENPMITDHLLWAFFNVNLVGVAREIFCNVGDFQGLEVWRRINMKINDKGEKTRDELSEKIQNPKGTHKCEETAQVLGKWDTNQRLFMEAGGLALRD